MMTLRTEIPHVIIQLGCAVKTQRELTQGILRYVQQHDPWAVTLITGQSKCEPKLTASLLNSADGYIGHGGNAQSRRLIENTSLAVIYSSDVFRKPPERCRAEILGSIGCDNDQVGRKAAEYFLRRGFRSFAYIGTATPLVFSEERMSAFRRRLKAAGYGCRTFGCKSTTNRPARQRKALLDWLARLPARTAVFAANDARAQQVLNICANVGISVPGHLAVLACDNEEDFCETSLPPLSSIILDAERIGYAAAEQLDRFFLRGKTRIRPAKFLYRVAGVCERFSTDAAPLTDDPMIERALACIRLNAFKRIRVDHLAKALSVSRRLLEMRFRRALNKPVRDVIAELQIERVKVLLAQGGLSLETIAEKCGYSSPSHLCTVFKRHLGMTPGSWQRSALK